MKAKMIVTDLDRTLLRKDKTISTYTSKILKLCQSKGIVVVFATARPKRTVLEFFDIIPVDAMILHNGASVYLKDSRIFHTAIEPSATKKILLSISKDFPNSNLSVEIDDVFYSNFDVSTIWNYTEAIKTDFRDLPNKPAEKIIIAIDSFIDANKFSKYLPENLYLEVSEGKLGLIMSKNATKLNGINLLSNHFGISLNEVICFGDDYNDLSMIRESGIGVAVGNALEDVKSVAKYICDTNDNDGVAKWIEENVLEISH